METCDTTLDLMIERAVEKQWEEENPPAPANPIESLSNETRISAYSTLNTARFMLGLVLDDLDSTFEKIKDTPQGDKLGSLHDQLSDINYELLKIEREVWRCKGNA